MGQGKGSGEGECGCCQPCGICGIALKCAAFIWAIVHIVWGGLWVLTVLLDLEWYLKPIFGEGNRAGELWAYWIIYLLLAGCWLALGIILMLGVRCSTNICKVHFYLVGCIVVLGVAFLLGIIWRVRLGGYAGYGSGYGHGGGTFFVFFTCFWWWYPYWCIYAYYIELGGKSWCACEGCK